MPGATGLQARLQARPQAGQQAASMPAPLHSCRFPRYVATQRAQRAGAFLVLFLLSCTGWAPTLLGVSTPAGAITRGSSTVVSVRSQLEADSVAAGQAVNAALVLDMEEGWHVQAAQPSEEFLIATELHLAPPDGIRIGPVEFPDPKHILFGGQRIAVYGDGAKLRFTVAAAPDLAPGAFELAGDLTVQACDNQICLAPSVIPVRIPFTVVAADPAQTAVPVDRPGDVTVPAIGDADRPGDIEQLFGTAGVLPALLAIFLVGLALNLTPCVYPMLSVTVSVFGAQDDSRPIRVFFKAALYVVGIATMYSVLGTLAALTGGLFGGLMQSPWLLAGIALLLVLLALSMFGLYEMRPPAALMNRLGGGTAVGWAGVYLSGLLVGIFAAPCIGPPIVALLALVGARGDIWFGFGSFFVLALGLGAPYLVLGTFSGLLQRLPRSGGWMIWVRKVFGVALLGVAAFYGALALLPALLSWVPAVTLLAGGLYLGFVEKSGNERTTFRRLKWAVGVVALVGGAVMLYSEHRREPMPWESYQPEILAAAKAARQPVIIDFYADWCLPCHELERRTFSDPRVQHALRDHRKLKVDLTRIDAPESQAIMRAYDVRGVPTVIVLDESGVERPGTRVLGFMGPEEFLRRIDP